MKKQNGSMNLLLGRLSLCLAGVLFLAGTVFGGTTFFPYFATGGGWQAVLLIVNDSDESQTIRVLIGGPKGPDTLEGLTIDGEAADPTFKLTVPKGTLKRLVIGSSSQALQTGFIVLQSSDPISATVFFEARAKGEIRESVGIMPSNELVSTRLVPIETGNGRDVALAILPEALSIEPNILFHPDLYLPATLRLTLFDSAGSKVEAKDLKISQLYSRFITEIFNLPPFFLGYLQIQGISEYATPMVTALFFEWRAGGWEITAIPPIASR